jgi:hypothetical protein
MKQFFILLLVLLEFISFVKPINWVKFDIKKPPNCFGLKHVGFRTGICFLKGKPIKKLRVLRRDGDSDHFFIYFFLEIKHEFRITLEVLKESW